MEIIKREKVKSPKEWILEMNEGETKLFEWSLASSARQSISRSIKYGYKDREYETEMVTGDDGNMYLKVKRIK